MSVETDAGIVHGWKIDNEQYRVKLNLPSVLDLSRKEECAYVELGNPGVPHGIKEIPGLSWNQKEKLRETAIELRYDKTFPKGANINFYDWISEEEIRLLTYERGVEDYTLACGTGSASTALVLREKGQLKRESLTVHNPGGVLKVTMDITDDKVTGIYLEGPTEVGAIKEIN